MESAPLVNEKTVKRAFKTLYKTNHPAKEKEISTEAAAKLVSETLTNVGREYSIEQATEVLAKFDVDGNGMNHKKEVYNAVLIAADLDTLEEAEILELKAKWAKKKQKLLNSTPEAKAERKKNKNLLKGHLTLTLQKHNPSDSDEIPTETVKTIVIEVLEGMEKSVDEGQVDELLANMDSTSTGQFSEKECKMAILHLAGMRQVDLVSLGKKRAKRKLKAEKRALKLQQNATAE